MAKQRKLDEVKFEADLKQNVSTETILSDDRPWAGAHAGGL